MTWVWWTLAATWGTLSLLQLLAVRAMRTLPPLGSEQEVSEDPTVTVVVTARDEQARIGDTVSRLLAQSDVTLRLVVVDDRSTDATTRILAELEAGDPRLEVRRVDDLPGDWLGKPHGCHVGAEGARGDWLLFSDADTWLDHDVVARAVSVAKKENADHVCLLPSEDHYSLWGRAGLLSAYLGVLPAMALVNRDLLRLPIGVGAFNMVRREAYRAIGGHLPLRFEVVDDAKLGLLLQRAGYRTRVYAAHAGFEVQWAGSLTGMIRALEKNLFAMVNFSLAIAVPVVVVPIAAWALTLAGPFTGTLAGLAAAIGLLSIALPACLLSRRVDPQWTPGLLVPFTLIIGSVALAHSVWTTLRQGGICWRRTFYPLDRLRRGLVK